MPEDWRTDLSTWINDFDPVGPCRSSVQNHPPPKEFFEPFGRRCDFCARVNNRICGTTRGSRRAARSSCDACRGSHQKCTIDGVAVCPSTPKQGSHPPSMKINPRASSSTVPPSRTLRPDPGSGARRRAKTRSSVGIDSASNRDPPTQKAMPSIPTPLVSRGEDQMVLDSSSNESLATASSAVPGPGASHAGGSIAPALFRGLDILTNEIYDQYQHARDLTARETMDPERKYRVCLHALEALVARAKMEAAPFNIEPRRCKADRDRSSKKRKHSTA